MQIVANHWLKEKLVPLKYGGQMYLKGIGKCPKKQSKSFVTMVSLLPVTLVPSTSDNYLSIVGRSKDLIISGGYNVYPKEIEIILDDVEGVYESAIHRRAPS